MSNSRHKGIKGDSGRIAGGFVALPWAVLDSLAYARLSHPAKALLIEVARQYVRDNNGRLLLSSAYLSKRGFKSRDVISRGKKELLEAGFIHETVTGHRPNKASWYAITWQRLDKLKDYDVGAEESFHRGAFMDSVGPQPKLTREQLYRKWDSAGKPKDVQYKNAPLSPSHGLETASIVPPDGLGANPLVPSHGPIAPTIDESPRPPDGHHLEKPSAQAVQPAAPDSPPPATTRLDVARQHQQRAIDKHRSKLPSVQRDAVTRVRDEYAHDLTAWEA